MSKQDRTAVRTAPDLERKWGFGESFKKTMSLAEDAKKSAETAQAAAYSAQEAANNAQGAVSYVQNNIDNHTTNNNNPHNVTAAQVGARPSDWMPTAAEVGAVPTTRKVNGKALSSDISLTAADVGARPSDWMPTPEDIGITPSGGELPTAEEIGAVPITRKVNGKALSADISLTASDVGARPSTWTPTAAEVGAAPSGYGLGQSQIFTNGNIDDVCAPGWYHANQTLTIGGLTSDYWYLHVSAYGAGTQNCVQELFALNASQSKLVRRKTAGVWGEWEFENPPMTPGVEYRTTERYSGNVVYVQAIDCGAWPTDVSGKAVPHNILGCRPIVVTGRLTGNNYTVPYTYTNGIECKIGANNSNINFYSGYAISNPGNLIATLKYFKV